MSNRPPFTLPETPVDGYEVRYYRVEYMGADTKPKEVRAVYHAHTPWASLPWTKDYCGGGRGGAAFIDQWECFEGFSATMPNGRMDGWSRMGRPGSQWINTYATKEEATAATLSMISGAIVGWEEQAKRGREQIEKLRAALDAAKGGG